MLWDSYFHNFNRGKRCIALDLATEGGVAVLKELVKTADAYKPGMPYTAFLKLTYQDGTPVKDDLNPVSVKQGFGENTDLYESVEYPITPDGIIRLAFGTCSLILVRINSKLLQSTFTLIVG